MPVVEAVVEGQGEALDLARVDVDQLLDLSMEYEVTAVPTVLAFANGKLTNKFVGLQSKTFISEFVSKLIKTN